MHIFNIRKQFQTVTICIKIFRMFNLFSFYQQLLQAKGKVSIFNYFESWCFFLLFKLLNFSKGILKIVSFDFFQNLVNQLILLLHIFMNLITYLPSLFMIIGTIKQSINLCISIVYKLFVSLLKSLVSEIQEINLCLQFQHYVIYFLKNFPVIFFECELLKHLQSFSKI